MAYTEKNCETHYRGEGLLLFTIFYLSDSIIDSKVSNHWPPVTGFEYLLKECLDTTPLNKFTLMIFIAIMTLVLVNLTLKRIP